jgi:hypothetical protein
VEEVFHAMEADFAQGLYRVVLDNGTTADFPMPPNALMGQPVRRLRLHVKQRQVVFGLDTGEELIADLSLPGDDVPTVPVVYLDQLHWVALAQQIHAPDRLQDPAEGPPAQALIELAQQRKVVLSMAAAHFVEIAAVSGQRRRNFATTVLSLSRGWQMRNPLHVRADEYRAAMQGAPSAASDVFTRQPGQLFVGGPTRPAMLELRALPGMADLAELMEGATAMSALLSGLLDEPLDMTEALAAGDRWAATFPPLATHLRESRKSADDARLAVHGKFIADQGPEIAQVAAALAMPRDRFEIWLAGELLGQLPRMPSVGRFAELLYVRLRNADERWEGNDLNDMNFLSCAAAYADVVVGEKKTSEYLRRTKAHVTPGAIVCRKLGEAVAALTELGVDAA